MGTNRISKMGQSQISATSSNVRRKPVYLERLSLRDGFAHAQARASTNLIGSHGSEAEIGQVRKVRWLVRGAVAAQVGTDPGHSRPASAQSAPRVPWSAESRAAQHRLARTRRDIGDLYVVDDNSTVSNRRTLASPHLQFHYRASSARAMPWPPPMHSVTMPFVSPSRFIEWRSRVVRIAPVAPMA